MRKGAFRLFWSTFCFPAPLVVAGMAVVMEASKLVTVALLSRYKVGFSLRVSLLRRSRALPPSTASPRRPDRAHGQGGDRGCGAPRVEAQTAVGADLNRRVADRQRDCGTDPPGLSAS